MRLLAVLVGLPLGLITPIRAAELAAPAPPDPARQLREYRDFAMGHDGDPVRGQALFHQEQRVACALCHSVDGRGGKAGPDLYAVGDKFPRRELIRAVLEPSESIAVGYGTTLVEMKSGDEFQGVIKESDADALVLIGADGHPVRLAVGDIRAQRGSTVSLMPEGLHAGLSRQEFADLIGYLVTLKQPESALSSNRGMPAEIAELARPVALRPFFDESFRFPHAFVHKPGDVRSGLVWFGQVPGGSNVFLVVHQSGKIWRMEKDFAGTNDVKSLFGDLGREIFNERGPNGLLGLAFHPGFATNGRYFLKHQVFEQSRIVTTIVERRAAPDRRTDSGQPSRRIWEVVSATQDHSGGALGFGPDGFLYIAMGDTGPQQDPQGHGQDPMTHLGKILRIDVDRAEPGLAYGIPRDNPFRDRPDVRPEIWALGFREPWRFSFDRLTGDLWVGDVGQDRVEEAAIVRAGENHGWNVYEGFEPFSNRYRKEGAAYVPPIFAYRRKFGNSITGGFVYRGDPRSSFHGVYICGDYTSHRLFGVKQVNRTLQSVRQIGLSPQNIASFAEDARGNLYVVGYEGLIYQLDFTNAAYEDAPAVPAAQPVGAAAGAAAGAPAWERHAVPLPQSIWSVEAIDANADGRLDLIAMGETAVYALPAPDWKPQVLAETHEPKLWTRHEIARENGATNVRAVDLNRDGRLDVVASCGHGQGVFWFEAPAWTKHVIDASLRDPHALAIGDFDGDGDVDVAVASFGAKLVRWYEHDQPNQPDGAERFSAHDIDTTNQQEAYDLKAVDLDADGRLDLILAGRETRNVVWYRNAAPR